MKILQGAPGEIQQGNAAGLRRPAVLTRVYEFTRYVKMKISLLPEAHDDVWWDNPEGIIIEVARKRAFHQANCKIWKETVIMLELKKELSSEQREELLRILKARFEKNMKRHERLEWAGVQAKLDADTEKLWSLHEMERTGGEPDVAGHDKKTGDYLFYDCSAESPDGRRNVCYDQEALESRKEHKPENSAIDMAAAIGIELLTEEQYRELQKTGKFDTKTSSWVKTPSDIRKLGGALFCDRRYDTVFVYHNGAESYYAARGFRGLLRV